MSRSAAIIGGGVIGGGWLARFLLNGWDVKLYDPDPEAGRKIEAVLSNARHALPMLYESRLPVEGRLVICNTLAEAVARVEWVQESAPERRELKHDILMEIVAHAPTDAIIGSSTSGFTPSDLQSGIDRPERIIVAHPFNPVYLLPLVELVCSKHNPADVMEKASEILVSLGMFPLHVRGEIDAHIADRLLEAVWREALWLVHDGVATTGEIDNAIRYGFGLRWAQMGLFETYRIAGGEAGMKHFIEQFGPALKWPWTKLTDVPELTDDLVETIASQSDAQSGRLTINELERLRDNNLVAMMRALKARDSAAGRILNRHQKQIAAPTAFTPGRPIETISRVIPIDWTDYNGHMNESRYGQVFSDAADAIMIMIGADECYIAGGLSFFTVETKTAFMNETMAGDLIRVETVVMEAAGNKLRLRHRMLDADGGALASCDQLLIHVSLDTRRSSPPAPHVEARMRELAAGHADLVRQAG